MGLHWKKMTALLLAAGLFLSGCGPQLYPLSEDDEEQIALYCSRVISKFNRNQDKGMVALPAENPAFQEGKKKKKKKTDTAQAAAKPVDSAGAAGGTGGNSGSGTAGDPGSSTGDGSGSGLAGGGSSGTDSGQASTPGDYATGTTLTKAIGVKGIKFAYKGAYVADSYKSGDVYDIRPDLGNELVVMRVRAVNNSEKNRKVDLLDKGLIYIASYGDTSINNDGSILMNDLGTYDGTVKGHGKEDLVLLFQFPEGTVKDPSKLALAVQKDGESTPVSLKKSK